MIVRRRVVTCGPEALLESLDRGNRVVERQVISDHEARQLVEEGMVSDLGMIHPLHPMHPHRNGVPAMHGLGESEDYTPVWIMGALGLAVLYLLS